MATNWASLYYSFTAGMTDYISRHNANYSRIETCLNYLYALSGGVVSILDVPLGLQQIFDRRGIIGKASYKPVAGTLTGPNYYLTVAAGAYITGYAGTFHYLNTSTQISMVGRDTDTYYINVDSAGTPSVSDTPGTYTTWQFDYNSTTHVVSNVALYTGVYILFDGDDYQDSLTSAAFAETFESIAERFEYAEEAILNLGLDPWGGYYAEDPDNHSGLDFAYKAGIVRNDSDFYSSPADTVTLANNTLNYVELDPTDGTISANTTSFTSGQIGLFKVTTSGGAITDVEDMRTAALAGTGGGGGGHTQGTDLGTTATTFTIDSDATGNPTGRAGIEVENGDDPNAAVKFNRDTGKWQYTMDGGSNWTDFGTYEMGEGSIASKYIPIEDPELVHEEIGRGSSTAYEEIDLTTYVGSDAGKIQAVMLRVIFTDTDDDISYQVKFRQGGSLETPPVAYTVYTPAKQDFSRPQVLVVGADANDIIEFFITASGTDTASIRVYLMGYFVEVEAVGPQGEQGEQGEVGPGYAATSASSVAVGTGSKTFTTQAGLAYVVGLRARVVSAGSPSNWMEGQVTSYSSTTLQINVTVVGGSGTYSDWNIGLSGEQGPQGDPGIAEDTLFEPTSITVSASSYTESNKTGFINIGLVYLLQIEETGGNIEGTYDVEIYAKDTFLEADLLYRAEGIDPDLDSRIFSDSLPWAFKDSDSTEELHIRITNNDTDESATFDVTIRAFKFGS